MKKHFMCTHTFHDGDAKEKYLAMCKGISSTDWFASGEGEKAECIQNWLGEEDFWFCHWVAESDDDILELLEKNGAGQFFNTLPVEMQYYISKEKPTDTCYEEVAYVD